MLGCQAIALPTIDQMEKIMKMAAAILAWIPPVSLSWLTTLSSVDKIPQLSVITTRQLWLLLWRPSLTSQHLQDWPIFFIKLNCVHKLKQNKVLAPYVKLPCHKMAPWIPLPLNQWSHVRQTLRGRCWAVGPALQSSSSNHLVLILHRKLGNYLLSSEESYRPTAQHSQDSI